MARWHPPGQPYIEITANSSRRAPAEITPDAPGNPTQPIFYPPIQPPMHQQTNAQQQQLYQNADAYTYVDQLGQRQSIGAPVSRQQVLQQLAANKPASTSITGAQLLEGANASAHRGSGIRARSSTHASGLSTPRESALQHWLVPDKQQRSWAIWTSIFTLGACFVFAFMAGNFAVYQQSPTFKSYNPNNQMPLQLQWGPKALEGWLKFWETSPYNTFDVGYLMAWGARYQPAIYAGEWWRLFSSICLHGSFAHLFSNMLVFVVLAVPLEHSYGPFRIFAIFLASGFGGNFLSMAFEDPCFVYVGASGAVFGFIGLYLADIILNFESMYRPLLRLALMLLSLGLTLGIEFAAAARNPLQRVSHMSHVGGLAAGLFVSFLFLPNLADRRWKAARKLAARVSTGIHTRLSSFGGAHPTTPAPLSSPEEGQSCWRRNAWLYYLMLLLCAAVMLLLFVALPVYVYVYRMPSLKCTPLVA